MKESSMSLARKILLALLAVLMAVGGLVGVLMLDRGVSASAEDGASVAETAAEKDVTYKVLPSEAKKTFADSWSTPDDWTEGEHVTVTYKNPGDVSYSLNGATAAKLPDSKEVQLPGLKNTQTDETGNKTETYYLPVSYGSGITILESKNPVFYDTAVSSGTVYFSLITKDEDFRFADKEGKVGEDGLFAMVGYVDATQRDLIYFSMNGLYLADQVKNGLVKEEEFTNFEYEKDMVVPKELTDLLTSAKMRGTFTYDGTLKSPAGIDELNKFMPTYITVTGETKATEVKTTGENYSYTVKLVDGYVWNTNNDKADKTFSWSLNKADIAATIQDVKLVGGQYPVSYDALNVDEAKEYTISLAQSGTNASLFPTTGWTVTLGTVQNKTAVVKANPTIDGTTVKFKLTKNIIGQSTLTLSHQGDRNLVPTTLNVNVSTTCTNGLVVGGKAFGSWADAFAEVKKLTGTPTPATIELYGTPSDKLPALSSNNLGSTVKSLTIDAKGEAVLALADNGLTVPAGYTLTVNGTQTTTNGETKNDLTVNGNVTVSDGATLTLSKANYNGNITATVVKAASATTEPAQASITLTDVNMTGSATLDGKATLTFSGENFVNKGRIVLKNGAQLTGATDTGVTFNNEGLEVTQSGGAISAVGKRVEGNTDVFSSVTGSIAFTFENCNVAAKASAPEAAAAEDTDEAVCNGGAIYLNEGATFEAASVMATNCTATGNGGAVYVGADCEFTVSTFTATKCHADGKGGAVYLGEEVLYNEKGNATFTATTFTAEDNSAAKGGALYIDGGNFVVTNANNNALVFTGNTATENGAAVYINRLNAPLTLTGEYTDNVAENGGTIYVAALKNLTLSGVKITGSTKAGLYLADNATVKLTSYGNLDDAIFFEGTDSKLVLNGNTNVDLTLTFADPEDQASKMQNSRPEGKPIYVELATGGDASAYRTLLNNLHVTNVGYKLGSSSSGIFLMAADDVVAVVMTGSGDTATQETFTNLQDALNAAAEKDENVTVGFVVTKNSSTTYQSVTYIVDAQIKISVGSKNITFAAVELDGNKYELVTSTQSNLVTLKASSSLQADMIYVESGNLTINKQINVEANKDFYAINNNDTLTIDGATVGSLYMNGNATVKDAATVSKVVVEYGLLDLTEYSGNKITVNFANKEIICGAVVKEAKNTTATTSKVSVTAPTTVMPNAFIYTYTTTDAYYTALGELNVTFEQTEVNKVKFSGTLKVLNSTSINLEINNANLKKSVPRALNDTETQFTFDVDLTEYAKNTANDTTITLNVSITGVTLAASTTVIARSFNAVLLNTASKPNMTLSMPTTNWEYYPVENGNKAKNPVAYGAGDVLLDRLYINADGYATFVETVGETTVEHEIFIGKKAVANVDGMQVALIDADYVAETGTGANHVDAHTTLTFSVGNAFNEYEFILQKQAGGFDSESVWVKAENGVVTLWAVADGNIAYTLWARKAAETNGLPSNAVQVGKLANNNYATYTTLNSTQNAEKVDFETAYDAVFNGTTLKNFAKRDVALAAFTTLFQKKVAVTADTAKAVLQSKFENAEYGLAQLFVNEWIQNHGNALKQAANYACGASFTGVDAVTTTANISALLAALKEAYAEAGELKGAYDTQCNTFTSYLTLGNLFEETLQAFYDANVYTATVGGVSKSLPLDDATFSYIKVAMHAIYSNVKVAGFRDALLAAFAGVNSIADAEKLYNNSVNNATLAETIEAAYNKYETKGVALTAEYKALMTELANAANNVSAIESGYASRLAFAAEKDSAIAVLDAAYTAIFGSDTQKTYSEDVKNAILNAQTQENLLATLKAQVVSLLGTEVTGGVLKQKDSQNVADILTAAQTAVNEAKTVAAVGEAVKDVNKDVLAQRADDAKDAADMYKAALALYLGITFTEADKTYQDAYKAILAKTEHVVAANEELQKQLIATLKTLHDANDVAGNYKTYLGGFDDAIKEAVAAADGAEDGQHYVADLKASNTAILAIINVRLDAAKKEAKDEILKYYNALKNETQTVESIASVDFYMTLISDLDAVAFTGEKAQTNMGDALAAVNSALVKAVGSVIDSLRITDEDGKVLDSKKVAEAVDALKDAYKVGYNDSDAGDVYGDIYTRLCTKLMTTQSTKAATTDEDVAATKAVKDAREKELDDVKVALRNAYLTITGQSVDLVENQTTKLHSLPISGVPKDFSDAWAAITAQTINYTAAAEELLEQVQGFIKALYTKQDSTEIQNLGKSAQDQVTSLLSGESAQYAGDIVWGQHTQLYPGTSLKAAIENLRTADRNTIEALLKSAYEALYGEALAGDKLTALQVEIAECATLTALNNLVNQKLGNGSSNNGEWLTAYTTGVTGFSTEVIAIQNAVSTAVNAANTSNNIVAVKLDEATRGKSVITLLGELHYKVAFYNYKQKAIAELTALQTAINGFKSQNVITDITSKVAADVTAATGSINGVTFTTFTAAAYATATASVDTAKNNGITNILKDAMEAIALQEFDETYEQLFGNTTGSDYTAARSSFNTAIANAADSTAINKALMQAIRGTDTLEGAASSTDGWFAKLKKNTAKYKAGSEYAEALDAIIDAFAPTTGAGVNAQILDFSKALENAHYKLAYAETLDNDIKGLKDLLSAFGMGNDPTAAGDASKEWSRTYSADRQGIKDLLDEYVKELQGLAWENNSSSSELNTRFADMKTGLNLAVWKSIAKQEFVNSMGKILFYDPADLADFESALESLTGTTVKDVNDALRQAVIDAVNKQLSNDSTTVKALVTEETNGLAAKINNVTADDTTKVIKLFDAVSQDNFYMHESYTTFKDAVEALRLEDSAKAIATAKAYYKALKNTEELPETLETSLKGGIPCATLNGLLEEAIDQIFVNLLTSTEFYANESQTVRNHILDAYNKYTAALATANNENNLQVLGTPTDTEITGLLSTIAITKENEQMTTAKGALQDFIKGLTNNSTLPSDPAGNNPTNDPDGLWAVYKDYPVTFFATTNNALKTASDINNTLKAAFTALIKNYKGALSKLGDVAFKSYTDILDAAFNALNDTTNILVTIELREGDRVIKKGLKVADSTWANTLGQELYARINLALDLADASKKIDDAYNNALGKANSTAEGDTQLTNAEAILGAVKDDNSDLAKDFKALAYPTTGKPNADSYTNGTTGLQKKVQDFLKKYRLDVEYDELSQTPDIFELTRIKALAEQIYRASVAVVTGATVDEAVINLLKNDQSLTDLNRQLTTAVNALLDGLKCKQGETQTVAGYIDAATKKITEEYISVRNVYNTTPVVKDCYDKVVAQRDKEIKSAQGAYDAVYKSLTGNTVLTADVVTKAHTEIAKAANAYEANVKLGELIKELLVGVTTATTPAEGGESVTETNYDNSLLKAGDAENVKDFLDAIAGGVDAIITGLNSGTNVEIAAAGSILTKTFTAGTDANGVNTLGGVKDKFEQLRKAVGGAAEAEYEKEYKTLKGVNSYTGSKVIEVTATKTAADYNGALKTAIDELLKAHKNGQSKVIKDAIDEALKVFEAADTKWTLSGDGNDLVDYSTFISGLATEIGTLQNHEIELALAEFAASCNYIVPSSVSINQDDKTKATVNVDDAALEAAYAAIIDKTKTSDDRNGELLKVINGYLKNFYRDGDAPEIKTKAEGCTLGAAWTDLDDKEGTDANYGIKDFSKEVKEFYDEIQGLLAAEKKVAQDAYTAAYKAFKGTELTETDAEDDSILKEMKNGTTAKNWDEALQKGIKALIAAYVHENADSAKVVAMIAEKSGTDAELESTDDATPDNGIGDYEDWYKAAKKGIDDQRDAEVLQAKEQYVAIYNVLYGEENVYNSSATSGAAKTFKEKVDALFPAATVKDASTANTKLMEAVEKLIGTTGSLVVAGTTDGTIDSSEIIKYLGALYTGITTAIGNADTQATRRIPTFVATASTPEGTQIDKISARKVTFAEEGNTYTVSQNVNGVENKTLAEIKSDLNNMRADDVKQAYASYVAAYNKLLASVEYTETVVEEQLTVTAAKEVAPKNAPETEANFNATNAKTANELVFTLLSNALIGVKKDGTPVTYDYSKSVLVATDAKTVYDYLSGIVTDIENLVKSKNTGASREIVTFSNTTVTQSEYGHLYTIWSRPDAGTDGALTELDKADNLPLYLPLNADALRAASIKAVQQAYLAAYNALTNSNVSIGADGTWTGLSDADAETVKNNYNTIGAAHDAQAAIALLVTGTKTDNTMSYDGYIVRLIQNLLALGGSSKAAADLINGAVIGVGAKIHDEINSAPDKRIALVFKETGALTFDIDTTATQNLKTLTEIRDLIAAELTASKVAALNEFIKGYNQLTNSSVSANVTATNFAGYNSSVTEINAFKTAIKDKKLASEINSVLLEEVQKLLKAKLYYENSDAAEIETYLTSTADEVTNSLEKIHTAWNCLTTADKSDKGISYLARPETKEVISKIVKAVEDLRKAEKEAAIKEYLNAYKAIKDIELVVEDSGYVKVKDKSKFVANVENIESDVQDIVNAINHETYASKFNEKLLEGIEALIKEYANAKIDSVKVVDAAKAAIEKIKDTEPQANGVTNLAASGLLAEQIASIQARKLQDRKDALQAYVDVLNAITLGDDIKVFDDKGEVLKELDESIQAIVDLFLAEDSIVTNAKEANAALKLQLGELFASVAQTESEKVQAYLEKLGAAIIKLVTDLDEATDKSNNPIRRVVVLVTAAGTTPDMFLLDGLDTTLAQAEEALNVLRTAEVNKAVEQYKEIYKKVNGTDCPETDEGLAAIKAAKNVTEVNKALLDGVKALLTKYVKDEDPKSALEILNEVIEAAEKDAKTDPETGVLLLTEIDFVTKATENIDNARTEFVEAAKTAYVDFYNALTGKNVTADADEVKAAIKAITDAKNAKEVNAALLAQLNKLLTVGGGLLTEGASKAVKDFFTALNDAVTKAFEGTNDSNTTRVIPDLSKVVEGQKTTLDGINANEVKAAQDAYASYYEAITGEALEESDVLDQLANAADNAARNKILKDEVTKLINASVANDVQAVKDVAAAQLKTLDAAFAQADTDGKVASDLLEGIVTAMEEIDLERYKQAALKDLNSFYGKLETARMEAGMKKTLDDNKKAAEDNIKGVTIDEQSLEAAKNAIDGYAANVKELMLINEAEGVAKQEYLATYEKVTGEALKALPDDVKTALEAAAKDREYVASLNIKLREAIVKLLDSYVKKDGDILKDSKEVKALVDTAKNAVEAAFRSVASGKIAAVSKLNELDGLLAKVNDQRTDEKGSVTEAMQKKFDELTSGKTYSKEIQDKVKALLDDAKKKVEDGTISYADYELLQEQLAGEIKLYDTLDALTKQATEDGLDVSNVQKAIEDAIAELNATKNSDEVKKATDKAVLTINREFAKSTLEAYTKNDSDAVKSVLEGADGFYAKFNGAKSEAEIQTLVGEAKTAVNGERFIEKYDGLAKAFKDLSAADKDSLTSGQSALASNEAAVKDYLDARAKKAGYSSYSNEIADRLNKVNFAAEKAESISELNAEAQKLYSNNSYVRELLNRELNKLDAIGYEAQTNDANRAGYLAAQEKALGDAFNAAKATIQRAQNALKAIDELKAVLNDYFRTGNYNAEQEAELQKKYDAFCSEVVADGSTADVDALRKQLLDDFNAVPMAAVTSGNIKPDGTMLDGSAAEYPEGFEGNLWGVVTKKDGTLEGGTDLVIAVKDGKTMDNIEAARKNNKLVVANGSNLKAEDLKSLVGGKEVASTFDISLLNGDVKATTSGLYVVKVLLPESMRDLEGLQVVYEGSDGNVEVYETTLEGNYLVFTTAHFSEFVVLTDGPTNLLWLVITLSVVLGLELVALLVVLLKKNGNGPKNDKPKKEKKAKEAKKPQSAKAASVLPLGLLAGLVPAGALPTCIVLGVAVVVVGVLIGLFAKMKKNKNSKKEQK